MVQKNPGLNGGTDDIIEFFKFLKSKSIFANRILNAGCGRMDLSKLCNGTCYNLDIALTGTQITNHIISDLRKTPFPNKFFDVIILQDVLHTMKAEEIPEVCGEIRRILKNNGVLFIRARCNGEINEYQKTRISKNYLKEILERGGFIVEKLYYKKYKEKDHMHNFVIAYARRKSTSVRKMEVKDVKRVKKIIVDGWKILGKIYPEYAKEMISKISEESVIQMLDKGDVYVLELEGSVVGVVGIKKRDEGVEIGRLFIEPSLRGSKLGTEMMLEVFKHYKGEKILVRSALYPPTLAFYFEVGFKFKRIEKERITEALLERDLDGS